MQLQAGKHGNNKKGDAVKKPLALVTLSSLMMVACGTPDVAEPYPTRLVLADGDHGSGFHPATGHGLAGVSPVYDGLLRPMPAESGTLPIFAPALAESMPQHNADATQWTVQLKDGITFSDGTAFDAADVQATYQVAMDPEKGSEVASNFAVIRDIATPDPRTVVFSLKHPLADFAARLTLPIAPSEKVAVGDVATNELNTKPVGTGAFRFDSRRDNDTIFKANDNYWGGASPINELVITTATDDSARGQRVLNGELDGAVIPQVMAKNYQGKPSLRVDVAKGADWRAISLPAIPELADARVRRAINAATDRQALVDGPLASFGTPATSPITSHYGEAFNRDATFTEDPEQLLTAAGWNKNSQGIREKDGKPFHVVLYYPGSDTHRRDIAVEFASQMDRIGLHFEPKAGTWDEITPLMDKTAVVLGGGETPYDLTLSSYDYLHTRTVETGPYHNPGNYGSAELDQVLEKARAELDPTRRAELWRKAQELYVANPSLVMIANVDHVYVSKPNSWQKPDLLLEPHIHGATWGPWWRLSEWRR